MRLKIAQHAMLRVPKSLIAPEPEANPKKKRSAGDMLELAAVGARRSVGPVSAVSLASAYTFIVLNDPMLLLVSGAVFVAGSVRIALSGDYRTKDFFPGKARKVEVPEEPVYISPYSNWDNAFLPYAGDVMNVGYRHNHELPKGSLLGSDAMDHFYVWMNISDDIKKKKILKNFYGEVMRTSVFWSSMYCKKAVRFYAE